MTPPMPLALDAYLRSHPRANLLATIALAALAALALLWTAHAQPILYQAF